MPGTGAVHHIKVVLDGVEFPDIQSVKEEATLSLAEIARDRIRLQAKHPTAMGWQCRLGTIKDLYYRQHSISRFRLPKGEQLLRLRPQDKLLFERNFHCSPHGSTSANVCSDRMRTPMSSKASICSDARHTGIVTLQSNLVATRRYASWTLAYSDRATCIDGVLSNAARDRDPTELLRYMDQFAKLP